MVKRIQRIMSDYKIRKKEILRFLVGGGSAVITDYIVYRFLLILGWEMSLSKGVSYICGAVVGFIINKIWTFESKGFSQIEVVRYILLYIISAGVNAGVNKIVMMFVSVELVAFLCATGVSTIMNFFGQKFFVFVKKEKR